MSLILALLETPWAKQCFAIDHPPRQSKRDLETMSRITMCDIGKLKPWVVSICFQNKFHLPKLKYFSQSSFFQGFDLQLALLLPWSQTASFSNQTISKDHLIQREPKKTGFASTRKNKSVFGHQGKGLGKFHYTKLANFKQNNFT